MEFYPTITNSYSGVLKTTLPKKLLAQLFVGKKFFGYVIKTNSQIYL